jgi:hypothetical protein
MQLAWSGCRGLPTGEADSITYKYRCHSPRWNFMKPLLFLANAFINAFGITQPTEEAKDRAAWFIAVFLGIMILIVIAVAGMAIYYLSRH